MMRRMGKFAISDSWKLIAALLIPAMISAMLSCGSKPSTIESVEWRIERRAVPGGFEEGLSFFASTAASEADISELWIVYDQDRLTWKLTNANWTKRTEGSKLWIGSGFISLPDRGPIPRGKWRLLLVDSGGESTEFPFALAGAFPDRKPPSLSFKVPTIRVGKEWPETLIIAYDAAGSLLGQANAPEAGASITELLGADTAAKTFSLRAYGFEPASKTGYYSARVKTR